MVDVVGPTRASDPRFPFDVMSFKTSNDKQQGVLENIASADTDGNVHTVHGLVRVGADAVMYVDFLPDGTADPLPGTNTVIALLANESRILYFPEKSKIRFQSGSGGGGNFYIEPAGY